MFKPKYDPADDQTPLQRESDGRTLTLVQWAVELGYTSKRLHERIRRDGLQPSLRKSMTPRAAAKVNKDASPWRHDSIVIPKPKRPAKATES